MVSRRLPGQPFGDASGLELQPEEVLVIIAETLGTFWLQAVLSMFHSVQSILQSMQKQGDVYEEFVGQQDVTNEILEDVTKEEKEESYK